MKLETYFKPEHIGKTYKMMYNNKEIKVIFVSEVAFYQGVPRKKILVALLGSNNNYQELELDPTLITQVTKSRATKELREYGDRAIKRNKFYKKEYSNKMKKSKQLLKKYDTLDQKAFVTKLKKKHTNLLNDINFVLSQLAPNFEIMLGVEDYSGQDMEEYGIQDINDTLHYELLYNYPNSSSSTIELEYFTLPDFKMPMDKIINHYPDFTYTQLAILNSFILYAQRLNR